MYVSTSGGDTLLYSYLLYAVASAAVVIATLRARFAAGVRSDELAQSKGYELPPVRLMIHVLHLSLWSVALWATVTCLRYGWAFFDGGGDGYGWITLAAGAIAGCVGGLAWLTFTRLVRIDQNAPPAVAVAGIGRTAGIDREALSGLGREQFPQSLAHGHTEDLRWRGWLIGACVAALVLTAVSATEWGAEHGADTLVEFLAGLILGFYSLLPALPAWLSAPVLVSASLGAALLAGFNGTYTLMTFRRTLAVGAGLLFLIGWSRANQDGSWNAVAVTAVMWLVFSIRWAYDLYRARGFRRTQEVSRPISEQIARATPFLHTLRERPDCRLEPMGDGSLATRIGQGCRNVEEASPLVTRNLARFMSLVHIEHEHFAAATLRYLTVRRYITSDGGGGTSRPLQNTPVPMWDEQLFPLHPPRGYQHWLDPLRLGSSWDVVSICHGCGGSGRQRCGSCGGSGRRQESETYSEYSGGRTQTRTRTRTVTCSGCGGSGKVTCSPCGGQGRLVFHRTLNTQWQRLLPACTAPPTLLPEFMEEAEERSYFRMPLVENRIALPARPEHDGIGPDLEVQISEAVETMRPLFPGFAGTVERLHDGIVYRADFQVTGFQVLRIAFQRLPGKTGWFFGARPEFYFPALPISWSMIGTVLFVGPFLALTVLLIFGQLSMLRHALPEIY